MNAFSDGVSRKDAVDFINDAMLERLLCSGTPDASAVREILAKSLERKPLSVEETALLLRVEDAEVQHEIFEAARTLKREVYGNRIVLFAPLYVGNRCVNDCSYCAFKISNQDAVRVSLSMPTLQEQVLSLERQGHKRLILVFGEHPEYDAHFIADAVRTVYSARAGHGEIRRVNINAAPMEREDYALVKEAGIGTWQIFQETYHHPTYRRHHPPRTRKGDYLYRLEGLSRAMEGGIDDVGIGALFGLYHWKFEVLGLVTHALHLQSRYGVGPHTISFPRIRPACGVQHDTTWQVSDQDFKRLVAILRLAVPYTGLICTARENAALRREVMAFGVSQIDAGTCLELGGYTDHGSTQALEREQFELGDDRSLEQVMLELVQDGFLPSFCTACYRKGRTGEHFMEFAIPGFIKRFCTPNAIATLNEYLLDYASSETKEAGERLIQAELSKLDENALKKRLEAHLTAMREGGERDAPF